MGVRDGSIVNVSRLAPTGLVTFPSFHAAGAVLLASALWHIPYFRYFGLVLNGFILAVAPLHESHFLTDVLASAITAAVCLWTAGILLASVRQLLLTRDYHPSAQAAPVPI